MKLPFQAFPAQFVSYILFSAAPITQTSTALVCHGESSTTASRTIYGGRGGGAVAELLRSSRTTFSGERTIVGFEDDSIDTATDLRLRTALDRKVESWEKSSGLKIHYPAVANAKAAIESLSVSPDRIAITEDGSVLFSFSNEAKSMLAEFFGSGEIAAVARDAESEELFDCDNAKQLTDFIAATLGCV